MPNPTLLALGKLGAIFYPKHLISWYSPRFYIFIPVATPQDKIIDALETEIVRLKTQLSNTENRLSKMREKFDDMAIKLYGGNRN